MLGTTVACRICSTDSCDSSSKVRMESTSSPKKSMRKGLSEANEKTSTMLPRTEYWPASNTKSTRSKPYSFSTSVMKAMLSLSPTATWNVLRARVGAAIIFSVSASG